MGSMANSEQRHLRLKCLSSEGHFIGREVLTAVLVAMGSSSSISTAQEIIRTACTSYFT